MIIFDTETTGLLKSTIVDLEKQPHIIEFAAIKLHDETFEEIGRIEFFINPKMKLSKQIIKITNIKDEDLTDKETFDAFYTKLVKFFFAEKFLFGHNVRFDVGMLSIELKRLGKLTKFPWPPIQICTVNKTLHIKGYRLTLGKLYYHLFRKEFEGAHRAMADVEALTKCVRELIKTEVIKI